RVLFRSDLTVEAVNDSGITATNASQSYTSGGDSAGVTLAFNSVGWTAQNVLFNTIDAILGDPILAGLSFAGKADGGAQATLSDSDVQIGGDVSVAALSTAVIEAEVSNDATSDSVSVSGTDGKAFGIIVTSNKIAADTVALVEDTPITAAN